MAAYLSTLLYFNSFTISPNRVFSSGQVFTCIVHLCTSMHRRMPSIHAIKKERRGKGKREEKKEKNSKREQKKSTEVFYSSHLIVLLLIMLSYNQKLYLTIDVRECSSLHIHFIFSNLLAFKLVVILIRKELELFFSSLAEEFALISQDNRQKIHLNT